MSECAIELRGLVARLDRLEKENRRLKRTGGLLVLGLCALVLMGQAQSGRTVEAERFILRDQGGKMRAELSMDKNGDPSLKLYSENMYTSTFASWGSSVEGVGSWGKTSMNITSQGFKLFVPGAAGVSLDPKALRIATQSATVSIGEVPAFREGTRGAGLILNENGGGILSLNASDGPAIRSRSY